MTDRNTTLHSTVHFWSLLAIVVTLPFHHLSNSLAIWVLFLNWAWSGDLKKKWDSIRHSTYLKAFLALFFTHVIGIAYSSNLDAALFDVQRKSALLIVPLVLLSSPKLHPKHFEAVLKAFVGAIGIAALICLSYAMWRTDILNTFDNPVWLYFSYRDLTSIIGIQPTYLGILTCFAILILIHFLIAHRSNFRAGKTAWLVVLLIFFTVFLMLLASKTAIIAFIVILSIWTGYFFYQSKRTFMGIAIILGFLVIVSSLIYSIPVLNERFMQAVGVEKSNGWIQQYGGQGQGGRPEVRLMKWTSALQIIKENPLIGVGTGDVQDALIEAYKKNNFKDGVEQKYNAHNQFLETWIGLGLTGLLALLLCFIYPLLLKGNTYDPLLKACLLLLLISSLTESILCRQIGVVFASLFLPLLFTHSRTTASNPA